MFCVVVYHDYMHNTYSNKPTTKLNFIEVIDESIYLYIIYELHVRGIIMYTVHNLYDRVRWTKPSYHISFADCKLVRYILTLISFYFIFFKFFLLGVQDCNPNHFVNLPIFFYKKVKV